MDNESLFEARIGDYTVEQVLNGEHGYRKNEQALGPLFAFFARRGWSIEETAQLLSQCPVATQISESTGKQRRRNEAWLIKQGYRLKERAKGGFGWEVSAGIDPSLLMKLYEDGKLEPYFSPFGRRKGKTRERIYLAYLLSNLQGEACQSTRYMAKKARVAVSTLELHREEMVADGALWPVTRGRSHSWIKNSLVRTKWQLAAGKAARYRAAIPTILRSSFSPQEIGTTQVVTRIPTTAVSRPPRTKSTSINQPPPVEPVSQEPGLTGWLGQWLENFMWQDYCPTCGSKDIYVINPPMGSPTQAAKGVRYICKTSQLNDRKARESRMETLATLVVLAWALWQEPWRPELQPVAALLLLDPRVVLLYALRSKSRKSSCWTWASKEEWERLADYRGVWVKGDGVPVPVGTADERDLAKSGPFERLMHGLSPQGWRVVKEGSMKLVVQFPPPSLIAVEDLGEMVAMAAQRL